MSMRYRGGIISATSPTISTSSASGFWNITQQMQARSAGTWPIGLSVYNWIISLDSGVFPNGVVIDSSGYIHVAIENSTVGNLGFGDAAIIKFDPAGNIAWQKILGSANNEEFNSVAVDSSGNVYAVGTSTAASTNNCVLIAKYNTSGILQWQRTLGGAVAAGDYGYGIAVDSSGNAYIIGQSGAATSILIAKYDTSGTLQWQRTLNGASTDLGDAITVDSSSNVYIIGYATNVGQGALEIIIAKYNTSGTLQWQRTFGSGSNDVGNGIKVDSSGNIYICCSSPTGGPNSDLVITKYDTSGNLLWQRLLSRTGSDVPYDIEVDSFGNVYVCGFTDIASDTSVIVKYDTLGNLVWQRTLSGLSSQPLAGIAIDPSGLNSLCVVGGGNGVIAKLPNDGSKTGTYSGFTYSVTSSFANSAGSFVNATATLTNAASTLANTAGTLTNNNGTMVSTIINI